MKRISTTLALALATAGFAVSLHAEESVTVVSFGGSYAKACVDAYHKPFEEATGIKVNLADFNGGLAEIRAQVDAGSVHWDVVDLDTVDTLTGCDEGILEVVTDLELPDAPDGTSALDDYMPDSLLECGIGTIIFATVVAYNAEVYPENPPTKLEDYFDLENFPGRRGMRRIAAENVQLALLADGVAPEDMYDVLGTPEGVTRAFRKLDTIKDQIVWWEAGAQPPQMLADKEVVMTTGWNGRIFNAQELEKQPFKIIWNGHIRDSGQLSIVAGAPNLENARKFIQFASRTESQVRLGERIAYAPARYSGLPLIKNHVVTGSPMAPHMPTYPANSERYLNNDVVWWSERMDEFAERFSAWLAR